MILSQTQVEILVCSNLALQICKLAASLTRQECKLAASLTRQVQACSKFDTASASLKQVNANELVTTRQTCHKLAASNSLQTIAKTEYENKLGFERRHPSS
ncbi:hypothetical protein AVEN_107253-1 [Araneus ventricosus]|uniref:Uncharacterized protein n=1 Tax=Araneus ventricosus TaxID=182803 RepID=A0A4Y2HK82_ARAVE|nr:hypothetical protein AVEN_107253-1 [Araneus ventricosus]